MQTTRDPSPQQGVGSPRSLGHDPKSRYRLRRPATLDPFAATPSRDAWFLENERNKFANSSHSCVYLAGRD